MFKETVLSKLWLFDKGLTFVETTGGWGSNVYSNGSVDIGNTLGVYSSTNNGTYQGTLVSLAKIDITNYSKLKAVCSEIGSLGAIGIYSARNVNSCVKYKGYEAGVTELDLSDYNGEYYIGLYAIGTVGWTRISQFWLEP